MTLPALPATTNNSDYSLDPNIHLINPQGFNTSHQLLKSWKQANGCRKGKILKIKCKNVQIYIKISEIHLLCYE